MSLCQNFFYLQIGQVTSRPRPVLAEDFGTQDDQVHIEVWDYGLSNYYAKL